MIPQKFLDTIEWDTYTKPIVGGQMAGMPNYGIRLISKATHFEIGTKWYRSQIQNREFCLLMFELYLQEIKAI